MRAPYLPEVRSHLRQPQRVAVFRPLPALLRQAYAVGCQRHLRGWTRMSRSRQSAGILLYRRRPGGLEVFLAHPGGPFWAARDEGAWTIPKGLVDPGENPLAGARREFAEETGVAVEGEFLPLGAVRMKSGKVVSAWALEGDADPDHVRSNVIPIEWPPRSGRIREYPEVDRCGWFDLEAARRKIHPSQVPLLDRLAAVL